MERIVVRIAVRNAVPMMRGITAYAYAVATKRIQVVRLIEHTIV